MQVSGYRVRTLGIARLVFVVLVNTHRRVAALSFNGRGVAPWQIKLDGVEAWSWLCRKERMVMGPHERECRGEVKSLHTGGTSKRSKLMDLPFLLFFEEGFPGTEDDQVGKEQGDRTKRQSERPFRKSAPV